MINLGYACLNTELRKKGIFSSRTCRIKTLQENPDLLYKLIDQNLNDLMYILEWNFKHDIKLFRVSSGLFPFMSHSVYGYSLKPWTKELKAIGNYAKKTNQRLTMHVGQWTLLSSLKEQVTINSIQDIEKHTQILDMMRLDYNSVIVLHGGKKDGKQEILKNFKKLSKSAQSRIALENCELSYKVEDLLDICNELKVPLILDYHHYNLNNNNNNLKDLMDKILDTWYTRGLRPKFHLSESCENADKNNITSLRKHSDIVYHLPDFLPDNIDLMIEAKHKEQSIFILNQNYKHKIMCL